jgi:hypothetical protein
MVISLYTHLTPSANSLPDLFQSDHDFDLVSGLNHKAGLTTLERQAQTTALAAGKEGQDVDCIYYTIYGGSCSDPVWIRQHRDSGVLNTLIAEKETKMITTPTTDQELEFHIRDPCYVYVLLGACAMTLGCQLPDLYIAMLKKVYTEGGLRPDAPKQMEKALFGPDGYTNGTPYDLESKDLLQIANSMNHKEGSAAQPHGRVWHERHGSRGIFNTDMGSSFTSKIIGELRWKHNSPDTCASCNAKSGPDGKSLLMCSKCKDRKYCSKECQMVHWKVHKKLCELVKTSL